jgi:hypothetical protein
MHQRGPFAVAAMALAIAAGGCSDGDSDPTADAVAAYFLRQQAESAKSIEKQVASGELTGEGLDYMQTSQKDLALSPDQARCFGRTLVEKLGAERVTELGLEGTPQTSEVQILPSDTAALLAANQCRPNWKVLVFKYATEGGHLISEKSLTCITDSVTDEKAEHMAKVLADFQQGPELDEVMALYEKCLTPEELDRLDWN